MNARSIVIRKGAGRLLLYREGQLERDWPVAVGRNGADKCIEGDQATPLGEFYVCAKNPCSAYFRSLCLSYPNIEDAERGLAGALITPAEHAAIIAAIRARRMPPQHTRLGGEIYIHGEPSQTRTALRHGGTRGCIALENARMQELYESVALGTPVLIES